MKPFSLYEKNNFYHSNLPHCRITFFFTSCKTCLRNKSEKSFNSFSKKSKKAKFYSANSPKKIERKLARQSRKANKRQQYTSTDKKTRRGILVGLGSALSAQIAISGAISITKFAARLRFLGLFGGIAIILGVIAIILGVRSVKRRKQAVIGQKGGKWKIWFGIFLGILGILGTLSAIGIAV
jgi:hypothetical protein